MPARTHAPETPGIALALGGGGSRALAHLGVLEALETAEVHLTGIAGSSLGGLLAAMYAFEPDARAVQARAEAYFRDSALFARMANQPSDPSIAASPSLIDRLKRGTFLARLFLTLLVRPSLFPDNPMREAVEALLPAADIAEATLPLACNALDLTNCAVETFTRGPVRDAVLAGTAIATILPPVHYRGKVYTDAAPVCAVPVTAAHAHSGSPVLAIDLRSELPDQTTFHNGFDIFRRLECTSSQILNAAELAAAGCVLRPAVQDIFWSDFRQTEQVVARGRTAAEEAMTSIRALEPSRALTRE